MNTRNILLTIALLLLFFSPLILRTQFGEPERPPAGRKEVVFWHFWGGADRAVVADVVKRFNESQNEFWVREIAMPGNNQQSKLFLSTTGGHPPDLVNQDDPILAEWAQRGLIQAMDEIADPLEVDQVEDWLFPSARRLSKYDDRMFAVCNGLDIRALYYNRTALQQFGCEAPRTTEELDGISELISPSDQNRQRDFYAYLPDSRRLWAWGYVFGGEFLNPDTGKVTLDSAKVADAAKWMQTYAMRYGSENIAAFRTGDQSLPGKTFPLLPLTDESNFGRYLILMDGQWRTRDIRTFNEKRVSNGLPRMEFGVTALPSPSAGRQNAGWVNGNFFVIPKGAKNSKGAWEFIKFWIGFSDPHQAAMTCADGGWIPVNQTVVETDEFQKFLQSDPLFAQFVDLAKSSNQFPIPVIPGAPMFKRTVESATYDIMASPDADVEKILEKATQEIQAHLDAINQ
jgi:multiple sugar transport system substrate-binding protein